MDKQQFTANILMKGGKARLPIPFNPADLWGDRPRYHIRGTVNGIMVRGPLGRDDEGYFLSLGTTWLRGTEIDVNAPVSVELYPEGPQRESLAADINAALAEDAKAREFFDGLATFYRKGYINWIEGAKQPETRARRIAEMMVLLKGRKKQR